MNKKSEFRKLAALCVALFMTCMLMPVISAPANAATEVSNESELKEALERGETDITITKATTITINSLTINSGVTLTVKGCVFTVNSGVTLTVQGTVTVDSDDYGITSGVILNRGTIVNNGAISFNRGGINNEGGTFTNNNGGTVTLDYFSTFTVGGGTIDNRGTISTSSRIGINRGTLSNSGTLVLNGGGTIINKAELSNSGTINNGGIIYNEDRGKIINSGKIVNNGGTLNNGDTIDNGGTIDNEGGRIANGGTINNIGGGKIINIDKGVFDNRGKVNDNVSGGSSPSSDGKPNSPSASVPSGVESIAPFSSDNAGDGGQSGVGGTALVGAVVGVILAVIGGCVLFLRKRKI